MQSWSACATLLGTAVALNAGVQTHDRGVELAVDSSSALFRGGIHRTTVDAAGGTTLVVDESYDSYDDTDAGEYSYDADVQDYAYDSGLGAQDATPPRSDDSYDYVDAYEYTSGTGLGVATTTAQPECTSGGDPGCPWDYKSFHTGNWPDIGFPKCGGQKDVNHNEWQSPVDLPKDILYDPVDSPQFTALEGGCKHFELERNNHTFEAEFSSSNCTNLKVTWKNKTYTMLEFHFHSESENVINHEHFPGEMHMVHQAEDGSWLVLGVFLDRVKGPGNPFLTQVFRGLTEDPHGSNSEEVLLNPYQAMILTGSKFLSYLGSFTTPPCASNVEWISVRKPVSISPADLQTFKEFLKNDASQVDSYYQNVRPIQPLNDRKFKIGEMINPFENAYPKSAMIVPGPGPLDR